ncbi:MAG: transposase, partial [Clostridia bacterium]|nr:transposase [Clostridia bacterium]
SIRFSNSFFFVFLCASSSLSSLKVICFIIPLSYHFSFCFSFPSVRFYLKNISSADVEVVKRNELHKFAVIPKRWVVERSFAWIDNCRRLSKNCERLIHNPFQMVSLAFIRILLLSS